MYVYLVFHTLHGLHSIDDIKFVSPKLPGIPVHYVENAWIDVEVVLA
jgi:hypothetical protein